MVNLWNLSLQDPLARIYDQHMSIINSLGVLQQGKYLASTSADGSVKVWETIGPFTGLAQNIHSSSNVRSIAGLPDGNIFLVGSADGTIRPWGPAIGQTAPRLLYTFQSLSEVSG
jgi:WD40 repeat protein